MLIFVEGVPGSGKSSTAHFLQVCLANQGMSVKWWYEEERGHPVYCFHDAASLQTVIADLSSGKHQRVIAAALEHWQRFADDAQSTDTTVVLESCLFGYLTWSLFPFDVPAAEIRAYVERVERIIRPCDPRLIYLRQDDLTASLARMCASRGGDVEAKYVERISQNPYARRRGLRGFEGMVEYWTDYRVLTDRLFAGLGFPKLEIENSAGDWPTYHRQIAGFLSLPAPREVVVSEDDLRRFVGGYRPADGEDGPACEIRLEEGSLFVYNLPDLWERNRLVPKAPNAFYVDCLPFDFTFERDPNGAVRTMRVTGAMLMFARDRADRTFVRTDVERSG